jgi:hypothetical protein
MIAAITNRVMTDQIGRRPRSLLGSDTKVPVWV